MKRTFIQIAIYSLFVLGTNACSSQPAKNTNINTAAPADTLKSQPPKVERLVLITHGKRRGETVEAQNAVAKKWGLEIYDIGCLMSTSTADSIERFDSLIALKFGKNWKDSFYKVEEAEEKMIIAQERKQRTK